MTKQPDFDVQAAHLWFAKSCFNRAWDLIDLDERTPADDEEMMRLTHAAHWHWTQVEDHTAQNLSVGYWQTSRVYAVVGDAPSARRYGERCLEVSTAGEVAPFFRAYAHEALARAARLAGDPETVAHHLAEGRREAERVEDDADRTALLSDLDSLG